MNVDYADASPQRYFDFNTLVINFKDKKRKIIVALLVLLFTVMGLVYQTLIRPCQMSASSGCVLTSGCTSNSCVNHKQFKYDSSGKKKCCAC
jgi:hypothetical protein